MANELNIDLGPTRTGLTVTATLILNGSTVGSPVSLTETTTGFYSGDMPAVASGLYSVRFLSSGSFVGDGLISWDGTAERTLLSLPTVAQLEARTLPTADYFDPATDTVATVTSVTNAVVLPTIPVNWITAAGLATDAVTEIQSGLATAASVAAIPTNPLLTTDIRLNTLDAAISTRLASADYTTPPTASANATAVRTELSVELARIDANISTRSTYDGTDTTGTTTLLSRLTEIRAGYLDAAISSRLAAISYTEPLTILQTANAVTDALVAYPVPTLAQTQAAGFTTERNASLVATEAAAKAVADGRHVIDYLNSIATQYEANGSIRTVFDLLDQDGNPATTAQAAVERVPQP